MNILKNKLCQVKGCKEDEATYFPKTTGRMCVPHFHGLTDISLEEPPRIVSHTFSPTLSDIYSCLAIASVAHVVVVTQTVIMMIVLEWE